MQPSGRYTSQIVVIAMLLWALLPWNPYGYYILLRVVCFGVFAYLAFVALALDKQQWVWTLGLTALVYNPFIRIHLPRGLWVLINLITIGIAVASAIALKPKENR